MSEEWRPIPGYEGRYEVSNLGRLRSLKTHRGRPGPRILSVQTDRGGYFRVTLGDSRTGRTTIRVHQAVVAAFVGPKPFEGAHIRHLNGQKADNRLANLAYGTASENMLDRIRHGEHHMAARNSCDQGHPFDSVNTYVRTDGRACRVCRQQWAAEYRARQREKARGVPAREIREWALAQGLTTRRRATEFPDSVLDAFFAAHPEQVAS